MPATPNDLLVQLLQYIQEQAKTINPVGFQLGRSDGFLRHATDIQGLPGVSFDEATAGDHAWMVVPRLEASAPPKPAEVLAPFVKVVDDPTKAPMLETAKLARHLVKLDSTSQLSPDAFKANVMTEFAVYETRWRAWADTEAPRREAMSLYSDLFAIKHQIDSEETARPTELVWGMGVATWELSYEGVTFPFSYPLITQAIEIEVDEQSMALHLRPRTTPPRLEMDAFVACGVTGATEVERTARARLEQAGGTVSPFEPGSYQDLLKLFASNLDSQGAYSEILTNGGPLPGAEEHLVVTDRWVLLSRPRANNFLLDDLQRLSARLQEGSELPSGPAALVTRPSDDPHHVEPVNFRGLSSRGTGSGAPQELYFPLPYNAEQVTIVQRLERSPGVTVQGPPGTGKTHTIANIISHYLATGRRVLVTSRGEQALEVLQEKIPATIRPLTVALLTSDRDGMRQFQASIETIQHQVSQLNVQTTRENVTRLSQAIDRAHSELITIDRRIDAIAHAQLANVDVDGQPMRAEQLAEMVMAGAEAYGWFDDVLSLAPEHAPPLTDAEAGALREARRLLGEDLVYASCHLLAADTLPLPDALIDLHEKLARIKRIEREVEAGTLLALKSTSGDIIGQAKLLLEQVEAAMGMLLQLEELDGDWPLALRKKCRHPSFTSERLALQSLFADASQLTLTRQEFLKRPVVLPDTLLDEPKAREAIERASTSGKPFGLLTFGMATLKAQFTAVQVAGLTPQTPEDWTHVLRYVQLHDQLKSFCARWNSIAQELGLPALMGGANQLRHIEQTATAAVMAHRLAIELDEAMVGLAEFVFEAVPIEQLHGRSADLDAVRNALLTHLGRAELRAALTQLDELRKKAEGKSGPVMKDYRWFLDDVLGNPDWSIERVTNEYRDLLTELRRISGLSGHLDVVRRASTLLREAGAVALALRVVSVTASQSGEDATFPSNWRQAWTWARVKNHLASIEARDELVSLSAERREAERQLARYYEEVVAKAAWLATKEKASARVLQALAGYATAIRRIGQGTGPNAIRYRRDAREAMLEAAGAVPCWIMSHAKVSESMPADIGVFDLVIVDEASQSDLWALPAIIRGKKILVVGDDKQVSPDAGFMDAGRIQELRDRFLREQPFGVEMTPEKSLYDLAARVFAAEQVMLREHFRCVPPIIAYSNQTFYKGQIQPIRIPRASERIDPPLVDLFVPSGVRDEKKRNHDEAQAIADEIAAILVNPALSGRTIGVVSLLGPEQAKYIDQLVRDRLPAAELAARKFDCGEARAFQGSERDIMFLSLVVDRNRCKAVSGMTFEQRFNVAASRARDRMYLVRSVELSELSDKDLRKSLLQHFDKPMVVQGEAADDLIQLCESSFEREVFSMLVERGYRVIPQVKTGAYRIDMVVEGADDRRLAIECDGDAFHGPDRWQADTQRQRILERAGWTFWRCFASTWTLSKAEVFAELVATLTRMGIDPLGAVARMPTLVERRLWQPPMAAPVEEIDAINDVTGNEEVDEESSVPEMRQR